MQDLTPARREVEMARLEMQRAPTVSIASGLAVGRFLFAIGDVPATAFKDDPGGLDEPADVAVTFRAAR